MGYVVGIAAACDGWSVYLPIAHAPGGNLAPSVVEAWLRDQLSRAGGVVFANAQYDLEWLSCRHGIEVAGPIWDVQITEPLLDEALASYSLDNLAKRYGLGGKDETLLRAQAKLQGIDPKNDLWQLHPRYVGPYAEADASLTLQIHRKQMPLVEKEQVGKVWQLESALIPLIWAMRKQGVPVDVSAADRLRQDMRVAEQELRVASRKEYGFEIDEWSTPKLAAYCKDHGIQIDETEKGNPSITAEVLKHSSHPFLKTVQELRELNRLRSAFVEEQILGNVVRGRIHPRWHQAANDEGGAKTGRMSASDPNLQQVPSKSKWAARIRALFIPDVGRQWLKLDYSQQEPRILLHYALNQELPGAQAMADALSAGTDFYTFIEKAAGLSRKDSKTITLGRMYGMGAAKMAHKLGRTMEEAQGVLEAFDHHVPFVRKLSDMAKARAQMGAVRTLLGRRRRFQFWEPARKGSFLPMRREAAEAQWGEPLQRSEVNKALNAIIQGTAADMTKSAMLRIWRERGFVPYLQVHDELDYPVATEADAAWIKEAAETALPLRLPIKSEATLKGHW